MKKILFICLLLVSIQSIYAQGISINKTGADPHSSAMLDVSDTSKGILIPRMTTSQRNAIPSPANSLLIYQTDSASRGYYYYDSLTTSWVRIGDQLQNQQGSCLSLIPQPAFPIFTLGIGNQINNSTISLGKIQIPLQIIINSITISAHCNGGNPGNFKIGLYSEDGQTKLFEVLSDSAVSVDFKNIKSTINTPILIKPGNYYLSIVSIDTAIIYVMSYFCHPGADLLSREGNLLGYLPTAPNTLPATINTNLITYENARSIVVKIN